MIGAELGYVYRGSPVIWPDEGVGPEPEFMTYVPTTWPGARLPHLWLDDGTALHDRVGEGYTLLRLRGARGDSAALSRAFAAYAAPFTVLDIDDERPRDIYGYDFLAVAAGFTCGLAWQHLVDAASLAALATGH